MKESQVILVMTITMKHLVQIGIIAGMFILLNSCTGIPKSHKTSKSNDLRKVEFDLNALDSNGLIGPDDGKVALSFEFSIPNTDDCKAEVRSIDKSIQFMPGSAGRIGSGPDECLCVGTTEQNYRVILVSLAKLRYVKRIARCYFE
jgi:hypothetical protein